MIRRDRDIAQRMRDMLTHDKVGIKEGFRAAFSGDINKALGDYFDVLDCADIDVVLLEDGNYKITIEAKASRIKQFDTTLDVKRY